LEIWQHISTASSWLITVLKAYVLLRGHDGKIHFNTNQFLWKETTWNNIQNGITKINLNIVYAAHIQPVFSQCCAVNDSAWHENRFRWSTV